MNIWDGSSRYVVKRSCRVWCIAINFAPNMFCRPDSLYANIRFSKGSYISHHVVFHISIVHCLFLRRFK